MRDSLESFPLLFATVLMDPPDPERPGNLEKPKFLPSFGSSSMGPGKSGG